ncbi:Ribokinase-like protein [Chaetomium tenue]|uniref:Ribokinase-like protein n=1 Tax=Chaetomium tenue TaxID=1854479 RepID=A0ACB7PFT8_9PEZI|nr:Ribokinase-like protein [Chaetomium globosum]
MSSHSSKPAEDDDPVFVSLGTLGARMTHLGAARPERVGCHVLEGSDFPNFVERDFMNWGITVKITRDPSRLSARGLLKYSGEGFKENQEAHLRTAKLVDVYSPNHLEFLATFDADAGDGPPAEFDCKRIEQLALRVLESGIGRNGDGTAVVRCGEHGCMVAARSYPVRWFPALHELSRVVDVTGAGNAFLGAFAVTFSITSDLTEAAIAGTVAASFTIEQVGLPHRTTSLHGEDLWNGEAFATRMDQYRTVPSWVIAEVA